MVDAALTAARALSRAARAWATETWEADLVMRVIGYLGVSVRCAKCCVQRVSSAYGHGRKVATGARTVESLHVAQGGSLVDRIGGGPGAGLDLGGTRQSERERGELAGAVLSAGFGSTVAHAEAVGHAVHECIHIVRTDVLGAGDAHGEGLLHLGRAEFLGARGAVLGELQRALQHGVLGRLLQSLAAEHAGIGLERQHNLGLGELAQKGRRARAAEHADFPVGELRVAGELAGDFEQEALGAHERGGFLHTPQGSTHTARQRHGRLEDAVRRSDVSAGHGQPVGRGLDAGGLAGVTGTVSELVLQEAGGAIGAVGHGGNVEEVRVRVEDVGHLLELGVPLAAVVAEALAVGARVGRLVAAAGAHVVRDLAVGHAYPGGYEAVVRFDRQVIHSLRHRRLDNLDDLSPDLAVLNKHPYRGSGYLGCGVLLMAQMSAATQLACLTTAVLKLHHRQQVKMRPRNDHLIPRLPGLHDDPFDFVADTGDAAIGACWNTKTPAEFGHLPSQRFADGNACQLIVQLLVGIIALQPFFQNQFLVSVRPGHDMVSQAFAACQTSTVRRQSLQQRNVTTPHTRASMLGLNVYADSLSGTTAGDKKLANLFGITDLLHVQSEVHAVMRLAVVGGVEHAAFRDVPAEKHSVCLAGVGTHYFRAERMTNPVSHLQVACDFPAFCSEAQVCTLSLDLRTVPYLVVGSCRQGLGLTVQTDRNTVSRVFAPH